MSRMNELSCCIANLKAAADALLSVAETLTTLYSGEETAEEKPAPSPSPKRRCGQNWRPRPPPVTAHRYAPCSSGSVQRSCRLLNPITILRFSCRHRPSEARWTQMANHATLSASSSHRWMNCPPSVRLTEHIADNGSVYAAEGSEAHALCEYKLRRLLGIDADNPLDGPGGLQYYDSTMEDAANGYAAYVMELLEDIRQTCADPIVMMEQRLNFSRWVKDGFGTGDAVIVADRILQVVDFKYGTGVPVSAEGNSQMRLYALGALDMFGELYDIDTVRMTIYQPRLSNISTDTISRAELLDWAENTLRPVAELAYKGEGEIKAGSWCRFCKLRTTCRRRAEANLALAQHDFKLPPTLSDEEISIILNPVSYTHLTLPTKA